MREHIRAAACCNRKNHVQPPDGSHIRATVRWPTIEQSCMPACSLSGAWRKAHTGTGRAAAPGPHARPLASPPPLADAATAHLHRAAGLMKAAAMTQTGELVRARAMPDQRPWHSPQLAQACFTADKALNLIGTWRTAKRPHANVGSRARIVGRPPRGPHSHQATIQANILLHVTCCGGPADAGSKRSQHGLHVYVWGGGSHPYMVTS